MLFIINSSNYFLCIRTEAFQTAIVNLPNELMTTGMAFHLPFVSASKLILHIITEDKIGTLWVSDIKRIKVSLRYAS